MDFQIRVTYTIKEIGRENWDHQGNELPFSSYQWYLNSEEVLSDCKPIYILLADAQGPLARATFWISRNEPLPVSSPFIQGALRRFIQSRPLIICRTPLSEMSSLVFIRPELRQAILEEIASTVQRIAEENHASFVLFDYLDAKNFHEYWPESFSAYTVDNPGTRLEIHWPDFQAYLENLSPGARKDYRRHISLAERDGIRFRVQQTIPEEHIVPALHLIRSHEGRHGSEQKPWAASLLRSAGLYPMHWITAFQDDQMVGCGLLLQDGGKVLATMLGIKEGTKNIYFPLMYTAIQTAIEQGATTLFGGSGAYEFKQRIGFQREENNHFVFSGTSPILGKLTKLFLSSPAVFQTS